jgi:hypothetical protein
MAKKQTNSSEHRANKAREEIIAQHCGLIVSQDRLGHDAHHPSVENALIELKLIHHGKKNVGTKTHVNLQVLDSMSSLYWIVCEEKPKTGFMPEINRLWIAHPSALDSTFNIWRKKLEEREKLRDKIMSVVKKDKTFKLTELELSDYLLKHGLLMDNPSIPLSCFTRNGKELDVNDRDKASKQVVSFIETYPIVDKDAALTEREKLLLQFFAYE